jgi:hypothetical protein
MNTLEAEVTGLFDHEADANALVYAPLTAPHTYRRTRRYALEFTGSAEAAQRFIEQTLVEPVSQSVVFNQAPLFPGTAYVLDYGFKPGALDLEKEMILSYYRGLTEPGFSLSKLTITQRIYLFAQGETAPAEKFVKDIVNPAIHRHALLAA